MHTGPDAPNRVGVVECDPNGMNPHAAGAKLDAGKASIMRGFVTYFPHAIAAVASISDYGAKKYSWGGWLSVPDGIARYGDAMMRHVVAEKTEGAIDRETGLSHAAQAAWNAMARLELMIRADHRLAGQRAGEPAGG